MKKGLIGILAIMFFCNFGRVEYSALNPKAKTVQLDSTYKSMGATETKVAKVTTNEQSEQESTEATDENYGWSKYIVLGVKTFIATLLKLLIA